MTGQTCYFGEEEDHKKTDLQEQLREIKKERKGKLLWTRSKKDLSQVPNKNFDPLLIVRGPILKRENRKRKTTV